MNPSKPTGSTHAVALLVISNDQLAASFVNGTIKVFNLDDETDCVVTVLQQSGIPRALCQLENGYLASSTTTEDNAYAINIWNVQVQTIPTDHAGSITFLSLSPDGRLLASGSKDKRVKILSITY